MKHKENCLRVWEIRHAVDDLELDLHVSPSIKPNFMKIGFVADVPERQDERRSSGFRRINLTSSAPTTSGQIS